MTSPADVHTPIIVPIAFIGGGNMASAIIGGAVAAGVLDEDAVVVADPHAVARDRFRHAVPDASAALAWLREREASGGVGELVLSVKPQMLPAVAEGAAAALADSPPRTVTSILAGMTTRGVRTALGVGWPVVRAMPNTPARVRLGMTALSLAAGTTDADAANATLLFGAVGETIRIDESLMDAFTSAAGSGPAYVFYLAEAMTHAACDLGMTPGDADRVVRQTLLGASTLLAQASDAPEQLRAAVTSKAGTTAAATGVFDDADLHGIVSRAMRAARDRGRELGS